MKFYINAIANIPKSLKSRPVINLDECISESDLEETGIQIPIQLSLIDITGIGPYFNSKASDLVDKNSFSQASHVTCSSFPAVNNLDDGDYVKITNANAKVDSNALFDKVIQALWINHQVPYYPTEIIIVDKAKGMIVFIYELFLPSYYFFLILTNLPLLFIFNGLQDHLNL